MIKRVSFTHNIKIISLCFLSALCCGITPSQAEDGIADGVIRIGGVLDLEGRSKDLGESMKAGIDAAFKNETVKKYRVEYIARNDSYTPEKTVKSTNELIAEKVFLFAGNVGTPTAKVSLPILAKNNIPAVGFFTGAGLLRPGEGNIINYRASYVQETAAVIKAALNNGVKPNEVCAYVQNDAYGENKELKRNVIKTAITPEHKNYNTIMQQVATSKSKELSRDKE